MEEKAEIGRTHYPSRQTHHASRLEVVLVNQLEGFPSGIFLD